MNYSYFALYSYAIAILTSLGLIILTRYGVHDSGRRVIPDVTLGLLPEADHVSDLRGYGNMDDQHRIGNAVVIDTDFAMAPKEEFSKDLIIKGNLTLGDGARLHGSAKVAGSIYLGSSVLVVGNLISKAEIYVGSRAEVVGILHASKNIRLLPFSNVTVSAIAGCTIYISESARVGKQILANDGIVYTPSQHDAKTVEAAPIYASSPAPTSRQSSEAIIHGHRLLLIFDRLKGIFVS
jgi:predicted acyltransferase (DUF342 family)